MKTYKPIIYMIQRYDNDMHVSLLFPKYLSIFWQHKKKKKMKGISMKSRLRR